MMIYGWMIQCPLPLSARYLSVKDAAPANSQQMILHLLPLSGGFSAPCLSADDSAPAASQRRIQRPLPLSR